MTSTSTYVPNGLSMITSTEIRYSNATSAKYSGPNPDGDALLPFSRDLPEMDDILD